MRLLSPIVLALCITLQALAGSAAPSRWTMHSQSPAAQWRDAFVTGNGSHGTMVMGHPGHETITCVHEELFIPAWDRTAPALADVADLLPQVRALIKEGKSGDAAKLAVRTVEKKLAPRGVTNNGWPVLPHPAFDLDIRFKETGDAGGYHRQLNLETGEALSRWRDAHQHVEQRVFSSQAHNVNVVELRAVGEQKLDLSIGLVERPGRVSKKKPVYRNVPVNEAFKSIRQDSAPGWLFYHADYALDASGYEGVARVVLDGGRMTPQGTGLSIVGADRVLLVIRIQPLAQGAESQKAAIQKELDVLPEEYDALLRPHADKHGDMFRRVTMDFGCERQWQDIAIEDLLADIHNHGATAHFLEKVHAMGRYLLISTSGRYPAPLQGIWGAGWRPAWGGSFTTNSNVNLAVSAFGMGNFPEIAEGYYQYIRRQLPGWRANAKQHTGCRGILASLNMDPETGYQTHITVGHPTLYWVGGTGWNLRPLYDHALLSGDAVFMQTKVLPLYQELGLFYEDYLQKGDDGIYDVIPSQSPENNPSNTQRGRLTENSTFSVAVAKETFSILVDLGKQFGLPAQDIAKWQAILDHLPSYRINDEGALAEWIPERYEDRYAHRHNSHLYPVYPGWELVGPGVAPELTAAARVALDKRFAFDTTSAHGLVHAALMASRLHAPDQVQVNLNRFAQRRYLSNGFVTSHDPNHRVYNLDAALSLPRLLMEMLVFSKPGYIDLMPGWPKDFPAGSAQGILVRGGHKLDITWADGALESAVLHAGFDDQATLRYGDATRPLVLRAGEEHRIDPSFFKAP